MKKTILNVGKALNRAEQKSISGGSWPPPPPGCQPGSCPRGLVCVIPLGHPLSGVCIVDID